MEGDASRAEFGKYFESEEFVETHQLSEQSGEDYPQPENVARLVQSLLSDDEAGDQQVER